MNSVSSQLFKDKRIFIRMAILFTIVILSAVILISLKEFFDAALGAVLIYVLFRPIMRWLTVKQKWKKPYAALLIILITFIMVLAPIYLVLSMLIPKLNLFFSNESFLMQMLRNLDLKAHELTGVDLFANDFMEKIQTVATAQIASLLGQTFNMFGDLLLMYFILYFLLINVNKIESELESLIPMSKHNIDKFAGELKSMTISNAIGSPLLAIFQGIVASIGFVFFDVPQPFFWGMMAGVFSFIPFLGSAIIWLPASVFQLTSGHTLQGIGIAIFGILVISTVDNVFRFVFQKKFADVHPMITVFGIILGLKLFGLPGFIFGPLLISWLIILIKIYKEEYMNTGQLKTENS